MALKATWQRHADPHECLRGTEVTCHLFIFSCNSMVIVHVSIRYFGFKLTTIISSPYIRAIIRLFLRVGLCSLVFLIAGRVARYRASDGNRDEYRAWMRWTRGPPDLNQRTCFNSHLSESISTVNLASYNS